MTGLGVFLGALLGAMLMAEAPVIAGFLLGGLVVHLLVAQRKLDTQGRLDARQTILKTPEVRAPVEPPAHTPEPQAPDVPPVAILAVSDTHENAPTDTALAPQPPREIPGWATGWARAPQPAPESEWLLKVKEFLTGGNTAVRVGVIVLFFGVAFLLKYAAERNMFPIELRLAGAACGAIALLVIGWRLRTSRALYALALQGGGVGILYLTVFAALRLYALIPAAAAFVVLAAIALLAAMLAVWQNARILAVLGTIGGFLAPILSSSGGGNHVALFSYYAVLNGGIFAVAWFRAWRELNVLGFIFTFAIGVLWGKQHYQPGMFASTEPFLILFVLLYVAVAVLFAKRQAPQLTSYVDGTLVFGVPVVGFALQAVLMRPYEYGLAWSAFAAGLLYLSLATVLWRQAGAGLRLLTEAFLALGVAFTTLAIPLAVDGRWTSAAWALEGAAILWIGARQHERRTRLAGAGLQIAAGLMFLRDLQMPAGDWAVLNSIYLGTALLALAGLFSAWWLYRHRDEITPVERIAALVLLAWGALWWFGGGLGEIEKHVRHANTISAAIAFFTLSLAAAELVGARLNWPWLRNVALALPVVLAIALVAVGERSQHPFAALGWFAWPLALAVHYWILKRRDDMTHPALPWLHAAGLWIITMVLAWESHYQLDRASGGDGSWRVIGWALAPAALLTWITSPRAARFWPWRTRARDYLFPAAIPVMFFLAAWSLAANLNDRGDAWPLRFIPLLNPLDVTAAFVLLALAAWIVRVRQTALLPAWEAAWVWGCLAFLSFVWLNAALVRSLHHWAAVPFTLHAVLHSQIVQASLAVFWSLLALVMMVLATRRALRTVWLTGAALLAVVVVKLFLVDLASTGTFWRIVSFISVGVLLLIVGYFSPVPPRSVKEHEPA